MKRTKYSLLLGASVLLLAACGQGNATQETATTAGTTTAATTQTEEEPSTSSLIGKSLPTFTIVDKDGSSKTQADFAGKPTLYVAWASWCPDCQEQLPILNELRQEYADKVQFVFVNLLVRGETEAKAQAYMQEKDYQFDYYADKNAEYLDVMRVQSIPTTVLVDKDGTIKTVYEDVQTKETLTTALNDLLK